MPPWMKVRYCTADGCPVYSTMMYHPKNMLLTKAAMQEVGGKFRTAHTAGTRAMQAGQATLKAFAPLDVEDEAFWAKAWGHEKSRPTLVCLGQALPAYLQPIWLKMVSWDTWAKLSKDDEMSMRPLMEYIQRNDGETLPFRTARPHERLADCGIPDYFHGPVGLQELATEVVVET